MQFRLNPQQEQAVHHTQGPSLILAGAGSGKTRVLTSKVIYLIQQEKVQPARILMVTFTNKAAGEMKERISQLLKADRELRTANYELPFASTFHSLSAKILRRHGKHLGVAPNFLIYDEEDQKEVVKEALKRLDLSPKRFSPAAVLATISQAKNELISPLEYLSVARGFFQEGTAKVYLEYQKLLRQNFALDFDDLLMETVKLFREHREVLELYHRQFHYVLVDEYQDTNTAQYTLTKLLVGPRANLSVVGDASQSIYAWRGANFQNILHFKRDFPRARVFHLEQNYRSTQTILDVAHAVISKNTSHPVLKLWTENPKGSSVTLYTARSEHEEAFFIITQIQKLAAYLSDIAVLYRTNAQSRVIEEALLHEGIPYVLIGGVRFYERREIKDILAYLKLIINPHDMISTKRIVKIGKTRADHFFRFQKKASRHFTTIELLDEIVAATQYLELYDKKNEEDLMRLENIKELRSVASVFPDLTQFLENVALVEAEYMPDRPTNGEKKEAVTLMTLHAAKGLEFPSVFMIGMEEGLFPHSRSLLDPADLEEERRLCYVGITRAKEHLFLTYARRRLYFGLRTSNAPSRFLSDIPETLIEQTASDFPQL